MTIIDRCAELENELRERRLQRLRQYEREMRRGEILESVCFGLLWLGFIALVVVMLCQ